MVVINPEIENTLELENIEWKPLLTAHKNRSSDIYVDSSHKYLKKTKRRKGHKRDYEFYNLAFWKKILDLYNSETGSDIHTPAPYIAEGRDLIMQYLTGIEMDRLLSPGSLAKENVNEIMEKIGQLFKIKENEELLHKDLDLRHILINGGLYVIDLENAQYGNGQVKIENKELVRKVKELYKGSIDSAIEKGYESIPKISVIDEALSSIESVFGGRSKFYLTGRYRKKA